MKKSLKYLIYLILFIVFFVPVFVMADTQPVSRDVSVTATVPSKVCPQYSSVTINVTELLADASQKATITVKLKDCSQVEMSDISVEISTDRGAIDTLNNVNEDGNIITAGDGGGVSGKTDTNGYAFFQISSRVPGKTLISTKVDSLVDVNQLSLTFTPLPFPKYVTVSVQVPKIISPTGSGEVTIFKPSQSEETSSEDLVTLGVKIVIPFWVVASLFGFFLLTVILFIVIVILISRVKRLQKKEIAEIEETQELVKKEEEEIEKIETGGKPPTFPSAD